MLSSKLKVTGIAKEILVGKAWPIIGTRGLGIIKQKLIQVIHSRVFDRATSYRHCVGTGNRIGVGLFACLA